MFHDPEWADDVYVFGYPPVALSPKVDLTIQKGEVVNPAITVQQGEVVNPAITDYWSHENFLYSAITRGGNSGGPIVAQDGRVVGIVAHDVLDKGRTDAPFYRGIPAHIVIAALGDLGFGDVARLEDWT